MDRIDSQKPTFFEFFAGGGMARCGLGSGWECLFANDFDPKKADSYKANWGADRFQFGDIHELSAKDLPAQADLAWASFPCQDLSLAGHGAGLAGERSGAFWGFWNLISGLPKKRRPKLLVIENVTGALTSNGGEDFVELCKALAALDYVIGAMVIDAVHFLPQSRPRLFIVCASKALPAVDLLTEQEPCPPWHPKSLIRAVSQLPDSVKANWRWWRMPVPSINNQNIAALIESDPNDVSWHTKEETARILSLMSDANKQKVRLAKAAKSVVIGTVYRRTRLDDDGAKVQRAEVRFDGVAGCLRTPGGGSSRQFIIIVEGTRVRTRLLSGREAARLMGLPDEYILPERYNDTYHLVGDGLAVPAVRYLRSELLEKLLGQFTSLKVAAE